MEQSFVATHWTFYSFINWGTVRLNGLFGTWWWIDGRVERGLKVSHFLLLDPFISPAEFIRVLIFPKSLQGGCLSLVPQHFLETSSAYRFLLELFGFLSIRVNTSFGLFCIQGPKHARNTCWMNEWEFKNLTFAKAWAQVAFPLAKFLVWVKRYSLN